MVGSETPVHAVNGGASAVLNGAIHVFIPLVGAAHSSHTTSLILSRRIGRNQPYAPQIKILHSLGLTICCTVSRKSRDVMIYSKYNLYTFIAYFFSISNEVSLSRTHVKV